MLAGVDSYGQVAMERGYANDVQKSDDDYLLIIRSGYVENEGNAVDGNPQTAATLNSTGVRVLGINLGGEAVIRLRFTGPDKPAPGTPVTVKMGMGDAVLSLLNNIRSEEHTSELQSLMRISYAVFCLKK